MKSFYAFVLGIALVLFAFNSVVTFATSHEEAVASQLVRAPENWDLTLKQPIYQQDAAAIKETLIDFIRHAPVRSYEWPKTVAIVLVTSIVFSGLGLIAEFFRGRRETQPGVEVM